MKGKMERAHAMTTKALRKAAWCRMDPVEKWTTLVDVGRCATKFLWTGDRRRGAAPVRSLGRWLSKHDETSDGATTTAPLPYAMRLRIVISLLMWTRCLRDVQDTMARLHLPYAPTTRLGATTASSGGHRRTTAADLAAHVFPTRLAERLVDPRTGVDICINGGTNETGLQIPAPHTWDPETSVTIEDAETESTFAVASDRAGLQGAFNPLRGSRERKIDRARRVAGLSLRPSADDDKMPATSIASARRRRPLAARHAAAQSLAPQQYCPTTAASVLDPAPMEDAAFHRNAGRAEGCPLSGTGELDACPVRLWASSSPHATVYGTMATYVHAHASILSSLYIQGRAVDFVTDVPAVAAYVRVVFEPLVQGGFLHVAVVDEGASDAKEPAYLPEWALRHAWVVPADSGLSLVDGGGGRAGRDMCHVLDTLLRHGPVGTVVVHTSAEQAALSAALTERCAQQQPPSVSSDKNGSGCRWTVTVAAAEADLPTILSMFSMVSLLTRAPKAPTYAWMRRCLPPHTRLVGVNAHAADLLWFYPHAMVLPMKVGNAFRFRDVERSVLWRRWPWSMPLLSTLLPPTMWRPRLLGIATCCSSGLPHADMVGAQRWLQLTTHGAAGGGACVDAVAAAAEDESAEGALVLERSVEFLANPSKWTLLSLLSAKLLRL